MTNITTINSAVKAIAQQFEDSCFIQEVVFTELKDKTYGTHIMQFVDESDDQDLTEKICAWLRNHEVKYECELCDDGYTEILISLK